MAGRYGRGRRSAGRSWPPSRSHHLAAPLLAIGSFDPDGRLVVEALAQPSPVMLMEGGEARVISGRGGHFSYPATVQPRAAGSPSPGVRLVAATRLSARRARRWASPLNSTSPAVRGFSIRPPSLGPFYLFGNVAGEGSSILRLWFADGLRDAFVMDTVEPDPDLAAGRPGWAAHSSNSTAGSHASGQDFSGA